MEPTVCPLQNSGCLEKQDKIIQLLFPKKFNKDVLYNTLMSFGSDKSNFDRNKVSQDTLVPGCQSDLYLYEIYCDGRLFFFTYTEALISSGIAHLFSQVYSGEHPETILTCKPIFFEKLSQYLSIGRVNGGDSIYMRMKQIAVRYLTS
ncbi:fe-S metabolism associated domain protein [Chlamydia ibidis]|uniref:Fe-S metabolism associated domain protein n=2 Tax=Chlamydia ibidis TaxID=1405396 RepID=S7KFF6_9CHLA|nr:SufE family protein [Chlamydia ibidis]EPP34911.1 fe-S metabolism associated domain protein [Chlamydia ibidis]EQM62437.1 fe-S metabolism associated domain protein [Chlamydia ibidis 10-1398/6]